jgi:hypothetical protein
VRRPPRVARGDGEVVPSVVVEVVDRRLVEEAGLGDGEALLEARVEASGPLGAQEMEATRRPEEEVGPAVFIEVADGRALRNVGRPRGEEEADLEERAPGRRRAGAGSGSIDRAAQPEELDQVPAAVRLEGEHLGEPVAGEVRREERARGGREGGPRLLDPHEERVVRAGGPVDDGRRGDAGREHEVRAPVEVQVRGREGLGPAIHLRPEREAREGKLVRPAQEVHAVPAFRAAAAAGGDDGDLEPAIAGEIGGDHAPCPRPERKLLHAGVAPAREAPEEADRARALRLAVRDGEVEPGPAVEVAGDERADVHAGGEDLVGERRERERSIVAGGAPEEERHVPAFPAGARGAVAVERRKVDQAIAIEVAGDEGPRRGPGTSPGKTE